MNESDIECLAKKQADAQFGSLLRSGDVAHIIEVAKGLLETQSTFVVDNDLRRRKAIYILDNLLTKLGG